jgi:hypothetical protein
VPDLLVVGYARSSRAGAALDNLAHSCPAPGGVDIAEVVEVGAVDGDEALRWITKLLGREDGRRQRLAELLTPA